MKVRHPAVHPPSAYNPIYHSQFTFLDASSTGLRNVHRSIPTPLSFLFEKQK
jgi:hypothetical protein